MLRMTITMSGVYLGVIVDIWECGIIKKNWVYFSLLSEVYKESVMRNAEAKKVEAASKRSIICQ